MKKFTNLTRVFLCKEGLFKPYLAIIKMNKIFKETFNNKTTMQVFPNHFKEILLTNNILKTINNLKTI